MSRAPVVARAPGKVILFGEHAVNRGQQGVVASVGLYAQCRATLEQDGLYQFRAGDTQETLRREEVLQLGRQVAGWLAHEDYGLVRSLARERFFAPQQYLLATALGDQLPAGMSLEFTSEIPASSGYGSGGAAFAAMVTAVGCLLGETDLSVLGPWAHLGDMLAHGGIASALDTQGALLGGCLAFTVAEGSRRLKLNPSLCFLTAHCGVTAPTAAVNARVRQWLAEDPSRGHCFEEMGLVARLAVGPLRVGDGAYLGHLMNLNQLLLEKIGVSCTELDRLVDAALAAGAYGAKLSGSGGGGMMVALAPQGRRDDVASALAAAGGTVYDAPLGVPGAACL